MAQGLAYFPGITQILGAEFNLVHGVSPSVCVITITPQANFESPGGTLEFAYGFVSLAFTDCVIDRCTMQRNGQGLVWQLAILDRRWKWAGNGEISAHFNVHNEDGSIKSGTEKTPRELIEMLFEELNESDYSVDDVPDDVRPEVEWVTAKPADALADLCDDLGCRVVLDLDNRIYIRRAGVGNPLPIDETVIDNSLTIDPPEVPDEIAILSGPDLFQSDFILEAVGAEKCGSIVPINDLTYTPADGWAQADFPALLCVDEQYRSIAKKWVFRAYRIVSPAFIPGLDGVADNPEFDLDALLPIDDEQCETAYDACSSDDPEDTARYKRKKAQVYGVYWAKSFDNTNNANEANPLEENPKLEYTGDFTIDTDRGIVWFDDTVMKNSLDDGSQTAYTVDYVEADLYLRTATRVRTRSKNSFYRTQYSRSLGGSFGTPTRYFVKEDLVKRSIPTFGSTFELESVSDNDEELKQQATYYLDAIEAAMQVGSPQTISYAGLVPIRLDGAIAQFSLSITQGGTRTTMSRNTEQIDRVVPYAERRMLEKARSLRDLVAKTKPKAIKKAAKGSQ